MKQYGNIMIPTPYGQLIVRDVLFCPDVNGTIIAIGRFSKNNGDVKFDGSRYTLVQNGCEFPSFKSQNCFFIPMTSSSTESVNVMKSTAYSVHDLIGHLLLQMLRNTKKHDAANNMPHIPLDEVPPCDSCALMKATHALPEIESHHICEMPGDVVAADIIGPFAESIGRDKFILTIADLYSGMCSALPLRTRSEAPAEIIQWINKFHVFCPHRVKRFRLDNAIRKSPELCD